ncbi:MAG: radical SAM/SPASM domain-containing protein [Alphaproteobacteria bacterium]
MDLRRFGNKVALFSNTAGTGLHGVLRRVKLAAGKSPGELTAALRRKLHRRYHPHEPMPFAQAIHLEVTNACNLKCVMCPRTTMDRAVGSMPRDLFEKIVAELAEHKKWIESVALMGLGEPFLHKNLFAFAALARQAGLRNLYTSTNATLLSDEIVARLLEEKPFDFLILSVDGVNKETYEAVRPGEPYETVEANVERLLTAKRQRGAKRPAVELQILLMRQTEDEVEDFCERWAPLLSANDRILIKEADTFGGQVDDLRVTEHQRREPVDRFACRQLWKDLSIGWDGLVTVCCKDVLYKLALGNARTDRLVDLWQSKRWNGIRRLHLDGKWDWLDPCINCREWWI